MLEARCHVSDSSGRVYVKPDNGITLLVSRRLSQCSYCCTTIAESKIEIDTYIHIGHNSLPEFCPFKLVYFWIQGLNYRQSHLSQLTAGQGQKFWRARLYVRVDVCYPPVMGDIIAHQVLLHRVLEQATEDSVKYQIYY